MIGLAQSELGEFHVMIEVKDLAQLDRAFDHVAERSEPTEGFHFGVNSLAQNVRFALSDTVPGGVTSRIRCAAGHSVCPFPPVSFPWWTEYLACLTPG
jgi:hypothetical protein